MNIIRWLFGDMTDKFWKASTQKPFRTSTPAKGKSHFGSNNHGKGESKIRRKMAARSRRINRGKK